jgi:hypothetical protein
MSEQHFYCEDLILKIDCCSSCHSDIEYGYPLLEYYSEDFGLSKGIILNVCCTVGSEIKKETFSGLTPRLKERDENE